MTTEWSGSWFYISVSQELLGVQLKYIKSREGQFNPSSVHKERSEPKGNLEDKVNLVSGKTKGQTANTSSGFEGVVKRTSGL